MLEDSTSRSKEYNSDVSKRISDRHDECSRCGQGADIEMDAICVAKTNWGYKPGAVITTAAAIRAVSVDTVVDQEKRWRLRLCNDCMLMGYVEHVRRAIRGKRQFLIWAPVVLFASLGFLALFFLLTMNQKEPLDRIWALPLGMLFLAAIVCILGIPITAVKLWTNRRRLKEATTMTSLPQKNIVDAFDGEAHRILESLEKGRKDYYGDYDLPQFSSGTIEGRTRGISFREVTVVVPENMREGNR